MLKWLFYRLETWHGFLGDKRMAPGSALAYIIHPCESASGSSPTWDAPMNAVGSFERLPDVQRELHAVGTIDRSSQADRERDRLYDGPVEQRPFLAVDPLFNTLYLASLRAMGRLAKRLGVDPRPHAEAAARLRTAIDEELWHPELAWYCARDLLTGEWLGPRTAAGAVALVDEGLHPAHRDQILARLRTDAFAWPGSIRWGVTSCERGTPGFAPWFPDRGAVSPIMNALIGLGARRHGALDIELECDYSTLAATLIPAPHGEIEVSFRELVDPESGRSFGVDGCSSTAALIIEQVQRRRIGTFGT
jgi:hypothetical protein